MTKSAITILQSNWLSQPQSARDDIAWSKDAAPTISPCQPSTELCIAWSKMNRMSKDELASDHWLQSPIWSNLGILSTVQAKGSASDCPCISDWGASTCCLCCLTLRKQAETSYCKLHAILNHFKLHHEWCVQFSVVAEIMFIRVETDSGYVVDNHEGADLW